MRIKDFNYEPHFSERIKLISSRIKKNTLLKTNDEIKIRICDKIIHKDMIIPFDIHKDNKTISVTAQPEMHLNWNL